MMVSLEKRTDESFFISALREPQVGLFWDIALPLLSVRVITSHLSVRCFNEDKLDNKSTNVSFLPLVVSIRSAYLYFSWVGTRAHILRCGWQLMVMFTKRAVDQTDLTVTLSGNQMRSYLSVCLTHARDGLPGVPDLKRSPSIQSWSAWLKYTCAVNLYQMHRNTYRRL